MKFKSIGAWLWFFAFVIISGLYVSARIDLHNMQARLDKPPIFEAKAFTQNEVDGYTSVAIQGWLTGEGKTDDNSTVIFCQEITKECQTTTVWASQNLIFGPQIPQSLNVVRWDAKMIVAVSPLTQLDCLKITINIDREDKTAEWVEEPINQAAPQCKNFHDNKIYKWTIEDPPFWNQAKKPTSKK